MACAVGDCIVVGIANVELLIGLCRMLEDGDVIDIVVRIVIRVTIIAKANSNIIRALAWQDDDTAPTTATAAAMVQHAREVQVRYEIMAVTIHHTPL